MAVRLSLRAIEKPLVPCWNQGLLGSKLVGYFILMAAGALPVLIEEDAVVIGIAAGAIVQDLNCAIGLAG